MTFTVDLATPTIEGPAQGSVINPNDPNQDGNPLTAAVSTNEDISIDVNLGPLTQLDVNETMSNVVISNVPAGGSFSSGYDNLDGTWILAPSALDGLTFTPPADAGADYTMTVSVTFTEGSVEEVFSGTLTVDVDIADDPTITVETQADVATSTEYMQLTDAPVGFMQVYQNGNWVNMLTGVNYEVTDDLQTRFIPDANAISGQNTVALGTAGNGTPGTNTYTGVSSTSDWGTLTNGGAMAVFTDGGLTVETSVSSGVLTAFNNTNSDVGVGIGNADGISAGEYIKLNFDGTNVFGAELTLDGLGIDFTENDSSSTQVVIKAFGSGDNLLATTEANIDGDFAETLSVSSASAIDYIIVTTDANGDSNSANFVLQSIELSTEIDDTIAFQHTDGDGNYEQ